MAGVKVKAATWARLADFRSKYTDFTITCHDASWKVHRIILAQHSKILAVACDDDKFQEGRQRTLDLSDHEPVEIGALVDYLYTFNYVLPFDDIPDQLRGHVGVLIVADKYDIAGLRALALTTFKNICLDEEMDASMLCEVIKLAYSAHPATKDACHVIAEMVVKRGYLEKEDTPSSIEERMLETPQFAVDIVKYFQLAAAAVGSNSPRSRCPNCGAISSAEQRLIKISKTGKEMQVCPDCSCY